jgi:hypothetical protein
MAGRDLSRFVTDLAQHLRNILVCKVSVSPQQLIQANRGALAAMKKMAGRVAVQPLLDLIRGLAALQGDLRWASDARTALEIGLIRLMSEAPAAAAAPAAATPVAVAPAAATPVAADPLDLVPANGKPVPVEEEAAADPPEIEADSQEKDAAAGLWQQMLQALACEGQMTLFLFGRPARPQFCGKTLRLAFGAADQINCREIGSPAAIKVLRDLASRFSGESLDVQVTLAEEGAGAAACASVPAADDWIGKIRRTADTLGIPVKMEE